LNAFPPAEGERRAAVGYRGQYHVSASLIYRSLRAKTLQWIRIADPEAQRVDDLQIGSHLRVDAFQVKWSQYAGNLTFNNLITESADTPCLIAQLAQGWRQLRQIYQHRVVVHLVTNDLPSVSANPPVNSPPPTPRHFAAFVEQVWKPVQRAASAAEFSVPHAWKPAWEKLQQASRLSVDDFIQFTQDCELEFAYHLPEFETATDQDQLATTRDIEHLGNFLFSAVADPERIIELSHEQLLARLGWKSRFQFRSRHTFPVDEVLYTPIEASVSQLENALDSLPGGYITVLGTPGSGKSTLLTQMLRTYQARVIRYYAYVPDAQDPTVLRGESTNFLHDVVLAIEQAGFSVGSSPSHFDRHDLLARFHQQLQRLHQNWQCTGRKTILLIDGLDHIAREQHPEHSLLFDLPHPDAVPNGVYIVLGSQTDSPFPDRVQAAVQRRERRIEMDPLSRQAVKHIVGRAGFSVVPSPRQSEQIYLLSAGHPLALGYLLNHLQVATDEASIDTILSNTDRYEGSIEAQYHSYWRQLESDDELVYLLGLLARLRRVIDLSWIATWATPLLVNRLRRSVAHYFRREDHNRWYFFHNSFRLFLIEKTSVSSPGVFDPACDRRLHHELAGRCALAPSDSAWAWEELYHRVLAEEHDVVVQHASQQWFRDQFLALRPVDAIETDIRLALRAAAARTDLIALTRLTLAGAEVAQRQSHLDLDEVSLVPLLLALDNIQTAVEHVRDGNRLRLNSGLALQVSVTLKDTRLDEEARRTFELAEPLDLLASPAALADDPQRKHVDTLTAWAAAAVHFRKPSDVIRTIRQVRQGADPYWPQDMPQDTQALTRSLQNQLLFHAGLELLDLQRWDDLLLLAGEFDTNHPDDLVWWFWLHVHCWEDLAAAVDQARANDFLQRGLATVDANALDPASRVVLAEGVYHLLGDHEQARQLLATVSQPALVTEFSPSSDHYLQPFLHRFRLNRLLRALGSQQPLTDIVPNPREAHQGVAYFERALCVIAHLWGDAWRGRELAPSEIIREVTPILRLFHRHWEETRNWTTWYGIQKARGEFFSLLVDAVAQHGLEATQLLRDAFEQVWDDTSTNIFWPTDVKREIILALSRREIHRDWVVTKLQSLAENKFADQNIVERVSEYHRQAKAWLALNDQSSAYQSLQEMLKISFGVGYRKDYQLNTWVEWLRQINTVVPEQAADRIAWFAAHILTLERSTEGDATRPAANELLATTFHWSPRRAISLFRWFLDQRIVSHEEAVCVLLQAAMESTAPPTDLVLLFLTDILMPIATGAASELVSLVLRNVATPSDRDKVIERARHLLSSVHTYALPSTRPAWRRGVTQQLLKLGIELRHVGLSFSDLQVDRDPDTSSLKLKDGSALSIGHVYEAVSSVSDLSRLLETQVENSYFDWDPVVIRLAEGLGRNDVFILAEMVRKSPRPTHILSSLCERLVALGHRSSAWDLGLEALQAAPSYGWSRQMDGGSRLSAFRALILADPLRARPLLFQTLVNDGGIGPGALMDVLDLLIDAVPIQETWDEINEYVQHLFEGYPAARHELSFLTKAPDADTPEMAVADLLMLHVEHPTSPVTKVAWRACAKCLLQSNQAVQHAVRQFLEDTEERQERLLPVLDAVSLRTHEPIFLFRNQLLKLCSSPNYTIQRAARIICKRLGFEAEQVTDATHVIALPTIYHLSLPPETVKTLSDRGEITANEPLPDSDDPVEIVRPYADILEVIATRTRFPKQNLCHRAVQIMRQLSPQTFWSAEGERRLRTVLASADLHLPFPRPRAVLARRAMFHIIVELMDAGILDRNTLDQLAPWLRCYDPFLLLAEPVARPSYIITIVGRHEYGGHNEEWLNQVAEALDRFSTNLIDGSIILAEETTLKRLVTESPTEIRRGVVRLQTDPRYVSSAEHKSFFREIFGLVVTEYPTLHINGAPVPLILRSETYTYDSPGNHWLALNPTVGYELGWATSQNGLFQWVDHTDQIMVESIWWVNGLLSQSFRYHDNEVGEGWLVLAKPKALNMIIDRYHSTEWSLEVERWYHSDEGRILRNRAAKIMHSQP
jgi:hypothetical protein